MKKTSVILFVQFLLFATSVVTFAQTAPVTAEANGITVSVLVKGTNAEVTVSAAYKGWVAVGFDPSSRMKDADFKIGYVKDGVAYARDDFGVSAIGHKEDATIGGKNDLVSFSGTEKDGITTMTFVFPLASGDAKDTPLVSGKTHTVILGASRSDSFTGMHAKVGKVSITMP